MFPTQQERPPHLVAAQGADPLWPGRMRLGQYEAVIGSRATERLHNEAKPLQGAGTRSAATRARRSEKDTCSRRVGWVRNGRTRPC